MCRVDTPCNITLLTWILNNFWSAASHKEDRMCFCQRREDSGCWRQTPDELNPSNRHYYLPGASNSNFAHSNSDLQPTMQLLPQWCSYWETDICSFHHVVHVALKCDMCPAWHQEPVAYRTRWRPSRKPSRLVAVTISHDSWAAELSRRIQRQKKKALNGYGKRKNSRLVPKLHQMTYKIHQMTSF